jgi:hypothetical protein
MRVFVTGASGWIGAALVPEPSSSAPRPSGSASTRCGSRSWPGSLSAAKKQNGMSRSVASSTNAPTTVTASTLVMSGDVVRGGG